MPHARVRSLRTMALLGSAVVVLAGAAACAQKAATASASTELSTGKGGETPACTVADLKISLTGQPERETSTTLMALMILENKSGDTCSLTGWAGVTLSNAANETVKVPTTRVKEPGAPTAAELKPGTSAAAGIKWTICSKGDSDCPTGNSVFVTVPGATTAVPAELSGFPAPERSDLTMKSLKIGSIQPSRQGVVAW